MDSKLKPPLVIDKSFAHKRSGRLGALADQYTLLVPSAFYYEVFTTEPSKRVRALNDFPRFRRIDIPSIQGAELDSGEPLNSVEAPELSVNPEAAGEAWELGSQERTAIGKYESAVVAPALEFWRAVIAARAIPGFSPQELASINGEREGFIQLCNELSGEARVQRIADEIGWVHAGKLDSRWFHFRLFQVWGLQALLLLFRYRDSRYAVSEERLEHDVHDLEYLMLGLHAGALATAETSSKLAKGSMAWRFRTLEPRGVLVVQ